MCQIFLSRLNFLEVTPSSLFSFWTPFQRIHTFVCLKWFHKNFFEIEEKHSESAILRTSWSFAVTANTGHFFRKSQEKFCLLSATIFSKQTNDLGLWFKLKTLKKTHFYFACLKTNVFPKCDPRTTLFFETPLTKNKQMRSNAPAVARHWRWWMVTSCIISVLEGSKYTYANSVQGTAKISSLSKCHPRYLFTREGFRNGFKN